MSAAGGVGLEAEPLTVLSDGVAQFASGVVGEVAVVEGAVLRDGQAEHGGVIDGGECGAVVRCHHALIEP